MTWKQLFGEPVVVLSAIQAMLQAVNWVVLHTLWVQIVVSALLAIVGVLLARSRVTPVSQPVVVTKEFHLAPEKE